MAIVTVKYAPHELAQLFPRPTKDDQRELDEHIRKVGLQRRIVLYQGKVLDGVSRQEACANNGVKPRYVKFEDLDEEIVEAGPLEYVVAHNLKRRHLTRSQRAIIATEKIPAYREAIQKRELKRKKGLGSKDLSPDEKNGEPRGTATARAAKLMGVSEASVKRAVRIKKESPELAEKVRRGEMTLGEATGATKAAEQKKIQREESLKRIEQVCGKAFADAVQRGTRLKTHKDLVAFAEQKDDDMRVQMGLIADLGWPLKRAQTFRSKNLTKNHRIQDLIAAAAANMRPFEVVIGGWTIRVDKPEK